MSQESDVCCTTSMYDIQNRCILTVDCRLCFIKITLQIKLNCVTSH